MAGKWKPGDQVRLKGTIQPKMSVQGANDKDANKVDCDWINAKGDPKQKTYHEDQLEAAPDDEDDMLMPSMG